MRATQISLAAEPRLQRVLLEKIRFSVSRRLDGVFLHDAEVDVYLSHAVNDLVATFSAYLYGKHDDVEEKEMSWFNFPATWFQMFKQQYFPKWLLDRYPVKYSKKEFISKRITRTTRVCPHINTETRGKHLEFLMYEPEFMNRPCVTS